MIKLIKKAVDGRWVIYYFQPSNSSYYGEIAFDPQKTEFKYLNVPDEIKTDAPRACGGLRYMFQNEGLSDEYTYAWY